MSDRFEQFMQRLVEPRAPDQRLQPLVLAEQPGLELATPWPPQRAESGHTRAAGNGQDPPSSAEALPQGSYAAGSADPTVAEQIAIVQDPEEDSLRRSAAVRELSVEAAEAAIPVLLRALADKDLGVAVGAAFSLSHVDRQQLIRLGELLEHESEIVQLQGLRLIQRIFRESDPFEPKTLNPLVKLLDRLSRSHSRVLVRWELAKTVGVYCEVHRPLVQHNRQLRYAATVLSRVSDHDKNAAVRSAAAESLAALRG